MSERLLIEDPPIIKEFGDLTAPELFIRLSKIGEVSDIVMEIMQRYRLNGRSPILLSEVTEETWIVVVKRSATDFDAGVVALVWPVPRAVNLTSGLAGPQLKARWQMFARKD